MNVRNILAGAAALGLAATGIVLAGPASASPGDLIWYPCATSDGPAKPEDNDCDPDLVVAVNSDTVLFKGGKASNIEALTLPLEVKGGDTISFRYVGPCGGGAPRLYVTLGGKVYWTADATEPCGEEDGKIGDKVAKKVSYTIPADVAAGVLHEAEVSGWRVAAAGLAFDSGADGEVTVTDVLIAGVSANFTATEPKPTPTATQSQSASPSPSATHTTAPSPSRSTAGPVPTGTQTSGGGLPVTGAPAKAGFVIGAILVAIGGVALVLGRRRRDDEANFEA